MAFPTNQRTSKMEKMSRREFGFRNFENDRLRVLAHCGWNGIFLLCLMRILPPIMGKSRHHPLIRSGALEINGHGHF
ncbi:MAG TPA: hypothetical protein DDY24_03970 [Alcaligenaceae bacterium]|nr:hypothetical protein [Alcaligenaceae bacterium]